MNEAAENAMGFAHFLSHSDAIARGILVVMVLMSLGSWLLIFWKSAQYLHLQSRSKNFLREFWDAPDLDSVIARMRGTPIRDPFSHIVQHGFTAIDQHRGHEARGLITAGTPDAFLTRALRRAIEEDKAHLERGLSFLATVASSAPFIGLFGTVWGIYHALMSIGMSGQASLDKVAGPVGEALIMTGIGLAVAIPAAIAYNTFARLQRNLLAQMNAFAHDIFAFFSTGLKTLTLIANVQSGQNAPAHEAR